MSREAGGSEKQWKRREFVRQTTSVTATSALLACRPHHAHAADSRPAILGGQPRIQQPFPEWPITTELEAASLKEVLQSGSWYRYNHGQSVTEFERQWAAMNSVAHCQATSSGTAALITALGALEIGPGDEVLVPPYTFIATINSVLLLHALPVFVDSDPATAQIDPAKIKDRITGATRCVIPVHLGGASCDMDQLLNTARNSDLVVVEDACQSHTGQWKDKRLGTLGTAGCHSFQNSKNLTSGEGGAILTDDTALYQRAQAFQNNGSSNADHVGHYTANGGNFRLTEFQGALLLAGLTRLEQQSRQREENAAYLDGMLADIAGVRPVEKLPGTTRHGYHLYVFQFAADEFAGMSKAKFVAALRAEGVPVSGGYTALNRQPWVERFLQSRGFRRIYGDKRLQQWRDQNHLPGNDRTIENTVWLGQTALLSTKEQMEALAEAIRKVQQHAAAIVQADS